MSAPATDLAAGAAAALLVVGTVAVARVLTRVSTARERLVASFAGGVSLAFVLLELFVELVEGTVQDLHVRAGPAPVHTIAMLILAGAAVAFGGHLYAERHPRGWQSYGVALAPQLAYRVLVGAALDEELHLSPRAFLVFWLAMLLHLAVAEHRLELTYPKEHRSWRQLVAASTPLVGALLWAWTEPSIGTFHVLLALVAGATILSIFREEIPSAKEARAGAFFAGVTVFGALIQARWWL